MIPRTKEIIRKIIDIVDEIGGYVQNQDPEIQQQFKEVLQLLHGYLKDKNIEKNLKCKLGKCIKKADSRVLGEFGFLKDNSLFIEDNGLPNRCILKSDGTWVCG